MKTTMIVDKKGKQVPQDKLNKMTDKYKKEHSPNQDYHLGYLHALIPEEDRQILANIMADGLFFGIMAAEEYGLRIKIVEKEEKTDQTMYG